MNSYLTITLLALAMAACNTGPRNSSIPTGAPPITGTWKLVSGTLIEEGDTVMTDYTGHESMIKIISASHFAFLRHDDKKGQDSTGVFVAGGGPYTLEGDHYTEFLEYCSAREWEGNTFEFTVTIDGDTLTQEGIEKIEDIGIERLNIEKYVRLAGPQPPIR